MLALYPLAWFINNSIAQSAEAAKAMGEVAKVPSIPGLGLNSFVLILAFAVVGYAIADLIFFPIYYKAGRSIVLSTLLTIIGFVTYLGITTIALPYIPGLGGLNELNIGVQFAILALAVVLSTFIHILVYKISSSRLEKVDF